MGAPVGILALVRTRARKPSKSSDMGR
jgi:hypothetical protein